MRSSKYSGLRRFVVVLVASVLIAGIGTRYAGSKESATAPNVSELAGKVSPARAEFVKRVDDTCRQHDQTLQAELAQADGGNSANAMQVQLANHDREYQALRALGPAPEADQVYQAWLSGVEYRLASERQYLDDITNGRPTDPTRFNSEYDAQLLADNENGDRFGLIFCVSAGPGSPNQ
jgi:hypothetical protein